MCDFISYAFDSVADVFDVRGTIFFSTAFKCSVRDNFKTGTRGKLSAVEIIYFGSDKLCERHMY